MKTYSIKNESGRLRGFEVTSAWIRFSPLLNILKSVDGITEVKRNWFNEDRILFNYKGFKGVVNEPFGDNSCYWIGLENDDRATIDITPIEDVFKNYKGLTLF